MKYILTALVIASVISGSLAFRAQAQEDDSADRPVELGNVQWLRDLDAATENANAQDKPIAILFQEVPG